MNSIYNNFYYVQTTLTKMFSGSKYENLKSLTLRNAYLKYTDFAMSQPISKHEIICHCTFTLKGYLLEPNQHNFILCYGISFLLEISGHKIEI